MYSHVWSTAWGENDVLSDQSICNPSFIPVTAGTYSTATNSLTTTLELKTIEASDAAAYTCRTKYTSDNAATESVQTLAILALRKSN